MDTYIAHIRKVDNEEQTVAEHNQSTANIAEELCPINGLKTAAYIAGLLHDSGKNTPQFLKYIIKAHEDPDSVYRGEVIHSSAGGYVITKVAENPSGVKAFATELICEAVISHHGLYDCVSPEGEILYEKRMEKDISRETVIAQTFMQTPECELKKLLNNSSAELNDFVDQIIAFIRKEVPKKLGNKSFYFGMTERMLMSLLIDADRIDTSCFMNGKAIPYCKSKEDVKALWKNLIINIDEKINSFTVKTPIDTYRSEISQSCFECAFKPSGIYRLVVPTGSGKTLSSLRYALNHAAEFNKKRIIYIAPYNSILEQNAEVIREAIKDDDIVLEHHCNVVSEEERYKELCENWDSPIVVTTAVQLLNTLFSSKTSSVRRFHALADSVIIMDEIQSLPIKSICLFNLAANYLTAFCNTSLVLCSATQPLLDKLEENSITVPKDMINCSEKYAKAFKRTELIDITNTASGGITIDDLAEFSLNMLKKSKNLLIIVNTKNCAKDLYLRLHQLTENYDEGNKINLLHLSTNMCPANRKAVLDNARKFLNKKVKLICISTQLIEAGVDISFETVIRSIAGLDSIVQAAGRCNRNSEYNSGNVYIVKIAEENISRLVDIKKAQDATYTVLNTYKNCPTLIDNDLLSEKAMVLYYQNYFMNRKNEMKYNLPEIDSDIVSLLSDNPIGTRNLERKTGGKPKILLRQAFKTAGENFEAIEEKGMVDIIIEYDYISSDLISQINSDISIEKQRKILKQLQQYSVSISENIKKAIDHGIITLKNAGVQALRKEYYSKEIGVTVTPSNMPDLIK